MGVPYTPQQTVATPGGIALIASSTLTRPSDTTAYAQYDLVANSTTAASVVATELPSAVRNNEGIRIEGLTLRKSSTTLTNANFRVYLFNSNPGTFTVGDNAAFNSSGALGIPTVSGLIGYFDVVMTQSGTAGAVGFGASNTGNPLVGKPSTGTSMYFVIEASVAYTPASAETFTVELGGQWS